jgi:hypothetical protein
VLGEKDDESSALAVETDQFDAQPGEEFKIAKRNIK